MTEDERTIWCGNLSEKVTEDILYELFLQAGPLDKIHIPKDRDGKQRPFGFITYKHVASVRYAISLFEGTFLHNRSISLKSRINNINTSEVNPAEQNLPQNDLIQLGKQMLQCIPNPSLIYGNHSPTMLMNPNQLISSPFYYNEDRRSYPSHPYQRESERHKSRYNNDHGRDNRRDYYSSSHRDNYRDSPHYSNRHESGNRQENSNRHDRRYYRS